MDGAAYAVIGYPRRENGVLYNVAGVLHRGAIIAEYRKQELPNYQVFDEKRYFRAGTEPCVVDMAGVRVGLSICEDIWEEGPTLQAAEAGVTAVIQPGGSIRDEEVIEAANERGLAMVFTSMRHFRH